MRFPILSSTTCDSPLSSPAPNSPVAGARTGESNTSGWIRSAFSYQQPRGWGVLKRDDRTQVAAKRKREITRDCHGPSATRTAVLASAVSAERNPNADRAPVIRRRRSSPTRHSNSKSHPANARDIQLPGSDNCRREPRSGTHLPGSGATPVGSRCEFVNRARRALGVGRVETQPD